MRRQETPARATGLVLTATTLMAIAAMAAGARAAHGMPVSAEHTLACGDSKSVRAVVAVVAAAARDLFSVDTTDAQLAIGPAESDAPVVGDDRPAPRERVARCGPRPLAERLLDLPPPLV